LNLRNKTAKWMMAHLSEIDTASAKIQPPQTSSQYWKIQHWQGFAGVFQWWLRNSQSVFSALFCPKYAPIRPA
jgi:hypothetical protein